MERITFSQVMTPQEFPFVCDCIVETIVGYIIEDYHIGIPEAFARIYNSKIFQKLNNAATGLYLQSPAYIYDYLVEEME